MLPTLSALMRMIAFHSLFVNLTTCGESVISDCDGMMVISFGNVPTYGFPLLSVIVIIRLVVCPTCTVFQKLGLTVMVYFSKNSSPSLLALFTSTVVPRDEIVFLLSTAANATSFCGTSFTATIRVERDFCVVAPLVDWLGCKAFSVRVGVVDTLLVLTELVVLIGPIGTIGILFLCAVVAAIVFAGACVGAPYAIELLFHCDSIHAIGSVVLSRR